MKHVNLGTIGSNFITHNILDGVMQTEGISLEAVYSRSQEKGEALAQKYGGKKVYTDLDAFLADEDVNVVYIASPNLLHYPQAKKALLAGKHVLLEKPFTTRLDHARELVELAKERNLLLVDAVPTACLPNFYKLQEQLPKIGKVKLVMGNFSQYSSRIDNLWTGEIPNVFSTAYAGGCLMDILFYNIYLNVALFGKPKSAVYYPNFLPIAGTADTSGALTLCYDGFTSQNIGAKDTWGVNFFQVEGEKGYIYATGGPVSLKQLHVVTHDGEEIFDLQGDKNRWYYEVQEVTRRLLAGDYDTFNARLETMLAVIETMEACRKEAGIFFPGD